MERRFGETVQTGRTRQLLFRTDNSTISAQIDQACPAGGTLAYSDFFAVLASGFVAQWASLHIEQAAVNDFRLECPRATCAGGKPAQCTKGQRRRCVPPAAHDAALGFPNASSPCRVTCDEPFDGLLSVDE